jgi:AmpD protein
MVHGDVDFVIGQGVPLMELDIVTGLLRGARHVSSPNADERPAGAQPEVLIIHAISLPPGRFGGQDIERFFCNRLARDADPYYVEIAGLEVSAHFLVRRDGELVQFVPTTQRAWHAGPSWCEGRARVNDFSIGIELEGTDEQPFEPVQYQRLAELSAALMRAYPQISRERIYGHADIAPRRKSDPGPGFNWVRYLAQLADETVMKV